MIRIAIKSALLLLAILLNSIHPGSIQRVIAQSGQTNLTVNGGVTYQTMNGVGSNISSWAWKGGESRLAIDMLVDTLDHNIFRVVHDPMDWAGNGSSRPATLLTNLRNLDPASLLSVYETPHMQDLWGTIEYLNSKGVLGDQIIVNFMGWTAPWMGGSGTYGRASFITDNPQTNQDIATMIASLVYYGHHRRDISGSNQNLAFKYVAPFNEPDYNGQEGPLMDGQQMNRIYELIAATLSEMGDTSTELSGPDTAVSPDSYTSAFSQLSLSRVSHFAWHAYSTIPFSPAASRSGIRADWMTERSVWCEECNNNQLPTAGEWAYGAGIGDVILGDVKNGFSAVLTWEGFDTFYYHDDTYLAWGHLACTQNGGGCSVSDTYPRVYTIRGRAWPEATIAKSIRPGMVRRELTTTLPNLEALAFYNSSTGSLSIVGHNKNDYGITINGQLQNLPAVNSLSLYITNPTNNLQRMVDVTVTGSQFSATIPPDTFFTLLSTDNPAGTPTTTVTPNRTMSATPTRTPTRTATVTTTPDQTLVETINPPNIASLPAGTNVLLNFDHFTNPSDGLAIPAGYAGNTWNTLVQGSPWAGIATWNFYIANGGTQGTITFPRPVIVNSVRVSSTAINQFVISGAGNPDVSITTSGNTPQTLTTGWRAPVTTLTLHSSTNDQVFDDLRFTTASSLASSTPASTVIPTYTPTATRTLTPAPGVTATLTPTSPPASTTTPFATLTTSPVPIASPTATLNPTFTPTNATTQLPDQIFADGFETGNLSAWSASSTSSGALNVSTAAALAQTYGMRAAISNKNSMFVTDDSPASESRYRARFYFDPNSITINTGHAHYLFYGLTGSGDTALRVEFGRSNASYRLRAGISNNRTAFTDSAWIDISDAPHAIEFDWQAAASPNTASGSLTLWIDGNPSATITGIANDANRIESIRLGAVAGIDNRTQGTEYFDAFQSNRWSYIGP